VDGAHDANAGFLQKIGDIFWAVTMALADPLEAFAMASEQKIEGSMVTSLRSHDQGAVVGGLGGHVTRR